VPAVPAPAVPVCSDAITMPLLRQWAVGPGDEAGALLHWSATFVALVTLNSFVAPALAELEFIPEFDPAAPVPGAEALAFAPPVVPVLAVAVADPVLAVPLSAGSPVSWTSLLTMVRIASRLPVNLYFWPERSVRVKSPVIGDPERQPVNPLPAAADVLAVVLPVPVLEEVAPVVV